MGDLDDDGDLDAFVCNRGTANLVWVNDGKANFSDSGQKLGESTSNQVDLGDLDGDGDLDAVVANRGGESNTIWINNGLGEFAEGSQDLGSGNSNGIALADLNSDGVLDAVVANWGTTEARMGIAREAAAYEIITSVEGAGEVSISPLMDTYASGDVVTIRAIPEEGHEFVSWGGDWGVQNDRRMGVCGSCNI